MAIEMRTPKIGDLVRALGHIDLFQVIKVDDHTRTADIKLIESGSIFQRVPWIALSHEMDRRDT